MTRLVWLIALFWTVTCVTAAPQKVRVISDIHAGSCWQGNQTVLFDFLRQTARDNIDVLVLNGDVYDFWLVPLNKPPPSFEDAIEKGVDPSLGFDMAQFRTLLNAAAKSVVEIREDNGNHDMWLTKDLVQKGRVDAPICYDDNNINDYGVSFEHGHRHSLFNQLPPDSGKVLPPGYFVTRTVATYACVSDSRVSEALMKVVGALLKTDGINDAAMAVLRAPTVFKSLLQQCLKTASNNKLPDDLNVPVLGVVAPDKLPVGGDTSAHYTLAQFTSDYAGHLDEFVTALGAEESARLLAAEEIPGQLDKSFGQESLTDDVIVLGHTHIPILQVVPRNDASTSKTPDVLVANAGAWVADDQGKMHSSYVDLIIDDIVEDYSECYTDPVGKDYHGLITKAAGGQACVGWNVHNIINKNYHQHFASQKFCRNLGDGKHPWCYTSSTLPTWQYCDVGQPASHCGHTTVRGAVDAKIFSFPNETPLFAATRMPSTGSRWKMTKASSEKEPLVV